jgi:hypothetical protein
LPAEVYALDGDYMVAPGARLEIGPDGKLYETMGGFIGDNKGAIVAIAALAAAWFFLRKSR